MSRPLRLHWFSPLAPAPSGIAEVTTCLLPSLARSAETTLWTAQSGWSREIDSLASVRTYNDMTPLPLGPDDVCVYQIGNNYAHHAAIWKAAIRRPGIVVLHDVALPGLFQCFSPPGTQRLVDTPLARRYLARNGMDEERARDDVFALTGLAVQGALGAVVHSAVGFEQLAQTGIPVIRAELPYLARRPDEVAPTRSWRPHLAHARSITRAFPPRESRDVRRLTIFGHLGFNRRLESTIQALACMPERQLFHLDVYGAVQAADRIRMLVRAAGLKDIVTLHGFVSDDELDRALAQTDLAINLRSPSMGESSLSQLRIWAHACPSVVTRDAWYAELGEDVVAYVRTDHEIDDLQSVLRRLLFDQGTLRLQGRRGQERLRTTHHPDRYAAQLVAFIRSHQETTAKVQPAQ